MTTSKKKLALVLAIALIILVILVLVLVLPPTSKPTPPLNYTLTITHTTGGITNPAPGNYTYPNGFLVTVAATAFTGYVFDYWNLDASKVTGPTSINVTMDANHTLHAVFSLVTHTLTISTTTGGTTSPAPGDHIYAHGTEVTVNATANTGYVFDHWELDSSDVGSTLPYIVTMNTDHILHAVFKPLYTLSITTTAGGTTDPEPGSYQFLEGNVVNVTAIPETNFILDHWELDGENQGASNPVNVTMNANHTLLAVFKQQPPPKYYLTVISPYGAPGGMGWYDNCTTAYATLDTGVVDYENGTRRVFTYWSGDASGINYSKSDPIHMNQNKTAVANWKTQYYLTVVSTHDTPTPSSGWFDAGTPITASVTSPVGESEGVRYRCTGWTGTGSVPPSGIGTSASFTINQPSSITWNWVAQYYLTVTSPYDSPTPTSGWFDAESSITASVTSPVSEPSGTRYICTGWTGAGSVPTSGVPTTVTFTINAPSSITWNWKTQYYLTVASPFDTTGGQGWYDSGSTAYAALNTGIVDHGNGTRRIFTNWSGDASGTNYAQSNSILMNGSKTAVANWKTQYYLTVETDPTGLSPAPTPSSGWYDNFTDVVLTAPHPSFLGDVEYLFKRWDVDGVLKDAGVEQVSVRMNMPHTATAYYEEWKPVGGCAVPIDKHHLLAPKINLIPWASLAFVLLGAMAVTTMLIRRRNKTLKWGH